MSKPIKMNIQKLSKKAPILNLMKASASPLKTLLVEVQWGGDEDLDLSAFGCAGSNVSEDSFVFTNEELRRVEAGEVNEFFENMLFFKHQETRFGTLPRDVLGGEGEDEPEQIFIRCEDWATRAPDINKINLWMNIYRQPNDPDRGHFGNVDDAVVRLINADTNEVIQEYQVGQSDPTANSMFIGSLTNQEGELLFKPSGVDGTPVAGPIQSVADILMLYYH